MFSMHVHVPQTAGAAGRKLARASFLAHETARVRRRGAVSRTHISIAIRTNSQMSPSHRRGTLTKMSLLSHF